MKISIKNLLSCLLLGFLIQQFNLQGQAQQEAPPPVVVKRDLFKSPSTNKNTPKPAEKGESRRSASSRRQIEPVSVQENGNSLKTEVTEDKAENRDQAARVTATGSDEIFDSNNSDKKNEQTSANKLIAAARAAKIKAAGEQMPPTEIYRVGVGDVLDIRLLNTTSRESTLFTVLEGGVLDYPLAGETIPVSGMTTDEIAEILTGKIKLYDSPEVMVAVRDFASHKIIITGLVEKPGEKSLRREAVPLFAILAEALQKPEAKRAVIAKADKQTLTVDLQKLNNDVLVSAGDVIKVLGDSPTDQNSFYFIAGSILTPGQKNFHRGLTLTQAILAAGGSTKSSHQRVVIYRQNPEGLLVTAEYNLKLIKNGKIPDPVLEAGDRIEVGN